MSDTTKDVPPRSPLSFYERAALISFVGAIFSAAIVGAISIFPPFEGEALGTMYTIGFGGLVISLFWGIISLFDFRLHSRYLTVWMALVGVLVSSGLLVGFAVFFFRIISGFGHQ